MDLAGKFAKIAETDKYVIVGLYAPLDQENIGYDAIRYYIAPFCGIAGDNPRFAYCFITKAGVKRAGCEFPLDNYSAFLKILK